MFSGESMFQNTYTAQGGAGMIAFASSFPGSIKAVEIDPAHPVVVQKSGFLASEQGVELSIFFQKKAGAGFFGGEGFIMQKMCIRDRRSGAISCWTRWRKSDRPPAAGWPGACRQWERPPSMALSSARVQW